MEDPRFRNELPQASSLAEYFTGYTEKLREGLSLVSKADLDSAFNLLRQAIQNSARIYVAGNGGSAAIADHLCCDWMKGIHLPGKSGLKVQSLTSNVSILTAIANDHGFDKCFQSQIEMLGQKDDVLVLISSSGNSPNIVHAVEAARNLGMKILGLCGFTGGKLKELSDVCLYVPVKNYGIVEDAHQVLMHVLAQFLAKERDQSISEARQGRATSTKDKKPCVL